MRRSLVYSVAGATLGLAALLTLLGVGEDPAALTNGQAFVLGVVQGLTELLPISSCAAPSCTASRGGRSGSPRS